MRTTVGWDQFISQIHFGHQGLRILDAVDVTIFCEMAFRGLDYNAYSARRVSPLAIGRKTGLDEKTVRMRIKGMENEGFIKYYQGVPGFALFGMKSLSSFRFEALNIATKRKVLEHVHTIPGIVEAVDYLGPFVTVSIAGRSSQESEGVADAIARQFELNKLHVEDRAVREPGLPLDRLDWQIIRELRYDARRPARDVSHALSITPRMTDYRISRLLGSGALFVRAIIDTQRQEGLIFYQLEVLVEKSKQHDLARSLKKTYGVRLWSVNALSETVLLLNLFGFTLKEPEEDAANMQEVDGVRRCFLFILKETIEPRKPNWIDLMIEEKIASEPVRTET